MIIIADKAGQLGNRLFLSAHIIAFAIEYNLTVLNPAFEDYACFFQHTYNNLFCCYPVRQHFAIYNKLARSLSYKFTYYLAKLLVKTKIKNKYLDAIRLLEPEELYLSSPEFLNRVKQTRIILLQGWSFRDEPNLIKHSEKIKVYFTPLEIHQSNVNNLINKIKQTCDILVGVHIRQGDYKDFAGGKYFYSSNQYLQVMEKVERLFPNQKVAFLICSNNQQGKTDFANLSVTFGNNHIIEDMYSFAQCDYIIGPPSTYTLWASFYGNVPLYKIQDPELPVNFQTY